MGTAAAAVATKAKATTSIPTIAQSVHVDPGSAMSSIISFIEQTRKPAETMADKAEDAAFALLPLGSLVEEWVGPHLASQYVDQIYDNIEATIKATGNAELKNPDTLVQVTMSAISGAEGWLHKLGLDAVETKINGWVTSAVTKKLATVVK